MPSHRKRIRDASTSTDPKQKTIADFFKRSGTSTTPSTNHSTGSVTRPSNRARASPPNSSNISSERLLRVARALADADAQPVRRRRQAMLREPDDDDDSAPPSEEDVAMLTQEELQVNAQLQMLECSQDVAQSDKPLATARAPSPRLERELDVDGDVQMTLPKRKRVPAPVPAPASVADNDVRSRDHTPPRPLHDHSSDDSDDSEALIREHQTQILRRSTRMTRDVQRFDPAVDSASARFDAFPMDAGQRAAARSAKSALDLMMKERRLRDKQDEQIESMRQDLECGNEKVGEQEKEFAHMADAEELREEKRVANMEKYNAPLPLFIGAVQIGELSNKYWTRSKAGCVHHLHDLLLTTKRGCEESVSAVAAIPLCISTVLKSKLGKVPFSIATMLFQLTIFDDSALGCASEPYREEIIYGLADIMKAMKYSKRKERLPSFVEILQSYGARFDDVTRPERLSTRAESVAEANLDGGNMDAEGAGKAMRNLRRACLFTVRRIGDGAELGEVIGNWGTECNREESILRSIGVCIRVLLCTFGSSRLSREVGYVIAEVLNGVSGCEWSDFRLKAAKYIMCFTNRLGLQVELTTSMLPHSSKRCRVVALDVAYLSLRQWCEGPGDNPTPRNIESYTASAAARSRGVDTISYCIADMIEVLKVMPEPSKETEAEWACNMSKLLKVTIADVDVLQLREEGEIGKMYQLVQKMRTLTHRMVFDAPVQEMRLALDALRIAVGNALGNCKAMQKEMNPQLKFEKKQGNLSALLVSPSVTL